jgi:lipoate-protein ligase A
MTVLPPLAEPTPPDVASWRIRIEREPASPAAMLRTEQDLLDDVRDGKLPPICRIWQASSCIVVPRHLTDLPLFAEARAVMEAMGWPVLSRPSGGSPVPLMPGILNLSFVYPVAANTAWGLEVAYRHLLDPLRQALRDFGLPTQIGEVKGSLCAGRFDLAVAGGKIAGTAQRRRSGGRHGSSVILAHATLWVAPPIEVACAAIASFLAALGRPAEFRRDAMTSLAAELGDQRSPEHLTNEFADALVARMEARRAVSAAGPAASRAVPGPAYRPPSCRA